MDDCDYMIIDELGNKLFFRNNDRRVFMRDARCFCPRCGHGLFGFDRETGDPTCSGCGSRDRSVTKGTYYTCG